MFRLPALVAGLLVAAAPLCAQVEVGPIVGIYVPTSDISTSGAGGAFGSNFKVRTSVAFGGIARLWPSRRLGLEASLLTSNTSVDQHGGFGSTLGGTDAKVTAFTLAALIRFTPGQISAPIWLSAGAAFVNHSGDAFRGFSHRRSVGGALGGGARVPLGRRFGIDLGVRSLLYSLALEDPSGNALPSRFQIDMTTWAGVVLRLGHSRIEE